MVTEGEARDHCTLELWEVRGLAGAPRVGLPSLLGVCLPRSPLSKDPTLLQPPSEGNGVSPSVRKGREPGSVLSEPAALGTSRLLHGFMPPSRAL